MFKKKEEKSLLQWTIEEDGKYQSQLIDVIAERNDRINKAIEYIDLIRNSMCISEDYVLINILEILKGEDNE